MYKWLKAQYESLISREEVDDGISKELTLNVEWMHSMQKLEVRDGDIVVIRHPLHLSERCRIDTCVAIRDIIAKNGIKVRVMSLEAGTDIGVVRPEGNLGRSNL